MPSPGLGAEPIRELARVARPLAGAGTPGAWLGDLRVMAIDGVQLDVPDTADNEDAFGRGVSQAWTPPTRRSRCSDWANAAPTR
ncbi:hypothetical protein MSAR_20150 [Mycolicibacterium sarraceniae]|uniref:Transposase n=1 Tax=Mycolicibacterium sarraceniae TaxID=1534348 RepID=A0A7I7SRV6_9MYCO|nr:hypothetical protein MSAR_20150 [Mycolicibacterium sarraceniae]